MIDVKKAIQYANYHYYSRPLRVLNINKMQFPFPIALIKITTQNKHELHLRLSHSPLHALAAMELVDLINQVYTDHVPGYAEALNKICKTYALKTTKHIFINYARINYISSSF